MDAINITDNQTSVTRLCSLASCIHLKTHGTRTDPTDGGARQKQNRPAERYFRVRPPFDIHNLLCACPGIINSSAINPKGQNVFRH